VSPRQRAAAASRTRGKPVTFRGPPDRLASLLPLPDDPEALRQRAARLEGAEVRGIRVRPLTRERLNMGRFTLRLPKSTPPGTYPGSLEIGGQEVPIVGEVEPRPRLEASPRRLTIEAEPGGEVTADVVVVNTGNVPCEVPASSKLCVFDGSGVDHAFWVALGSDPPKGRQRLDVLLDELAESHGGLVEVGARAGEHTIDPGETREVLLTLRFSDRLRAGHTYAGTWEAEGLRLTIRVTVPDAKRRRKAAETPA
jgi:hypothetical protein